MDLFATALQHIQTGDIDAALHCYQRILRDDPEQFEAGLNAGVALLNLGQFHDALPYLRAAVAHSPSVLTCGNLAICLFRLTLFAEAEAMFRRVLAVDPENDIMNYNLAFNLLAQGKYLEGWRLHGWRKQAVDWAQREPFVGVPAWSGETLPNQHLAIYHEQGFGDSLLLSRYVMQAQQRVGQVSIICPAPLARLFQQSYGVATFTTPMDVPDVQCSMFDLPAIFQATIETIPTTPYLVADPERVTIWQQKLAALPVGRNVGLVWSGNQYRDAAHVALRDSRRSLDFAQLAPLFDVDQVNFISLQKGEAAHPCTDLPLHDWTDQLEDFAETAALVANLDLIIAVDTSVVHLAGALGKPVWSLNRYDSVYPWLPDGRTIAWYDTVREFRQPVWGDWDSVLQQVQMSLRQYST
jgi:Tetratricopeptide repeat/Glycosyltransferase family 9 (heptosyltransferase)